jgi:hypothetical protein
MYSARTSPIIKRPQLSTELFPPKAKITIHCFAFILELSEAFFLAAIFARHG